VNSLARFASLDLAVSAASKVCGSMAVIESVLKNSKRWSAEGRST
jgi:hypothetical protein